MVQRKSRDELAIEFASKREEWKKYPLEFFKEVLGIELPIHQQKMLLDCLKHNRVAICTGNSIGKCSLREDFSVLADGTLVKNKDLINKEFKILSYDKNTNKQRGETARATDNGIKDCLEIQTSSGKVITRTTNHQLYKGTLKVGKYTINKHEYTRKIEDSGWTQAKDLKVGDYILAPVIHENIEPSKLDFTDEEAKLLGYLIGDGGTTTGVEFTQEDNKQLKEFKKCCKKLGSEVNNTREYQYKIIGDGTIGGNPVLNKVKDWGLYGCKSTEKLLPDFVGRLPLRQIALILNRIFACDGYATTKKTEKKHINPKWKNDWYDTKIGITLANKDLIKQIRLLLMRFGIETWCRHRKVKYTGSDKQFDVWELIISKKKSIIKFCEQIGIYGKEDALNTCLKHAIEKSDKREHKYQYMFCPEGFKWEKITHINNVGLQPTVCIEVDNTHTYLTEVYDHNSFIIGALAFYYFVCNVSDDPNESTVIIITSVVFSQVKRSIFANIKHFAKRADRYVKEKFGEEYSFLPKDFSDSPNTVEYWFNELSYIMGISTDNQNAISGIHARNLLLLFDEIQGISDQTLSGFRGVLQSGLAKQILLGNPTLPNGPTGEFYNAMQPESNYHKIVISAFDTPNFIETDIRLEDMLVPEIEPNNWRNKLDKYCGTNYKEACRNDLVGAWENEVIQKLPFPNLVNPVSAFGILKDCGMNPEQYDFKTRILAQFPDGDSNCVINQQWLEQSMNDYENPEKHVSGDRVMGVDISGGLGRDFSTIAVRDGNKVIYLEEFQLKAPELEEMIILLYNQFNCGMVCLERDGIGKPIYDHLEERDVVNIIPINSGGGAGFEEPISYEEEIKTKEMKELYNRKRDELWFNIRNLLNPYMQDNPILLPRNQKLKRHLMCADWKKNQTGKIQVLPKEEMRKKIKESPDLADAVIFAYAPVGEAQSNADFEAGLWTFKNTSWT